MIKWSLKRLVSVVYTVHGQSERLVSVVYTVHVHSTHHTKAKAEIFELRSHNFKEIALHNFFNLSRQFKTMALKRTPHWFASKP